MARRTPVANVGWIACDEEIGAGHKKSWLSDASLLAALHSRRLAVIHRSLAFVLGWEEYRDPAFASRPVRIRPRLSLPEGEITAVEWITVDALLALAPGTSGRSDPQADCAPRACAEAAIPRDRGEGLWLSKEFCVIMPGAIARSDGSDIKSLLQRWFDGATPRPKEGNLQKRRKGRWILMGGYIISYGMSASLARVLMRLGEDRSRSLVGAILSKAVPAAFSTIALFSKMLWWSEQDQPKKPDMKPQPFDKRLP